MKRTIWAGGVAVWALLSACGTDGDSQFVPEPDDDAGMGAGASSSTGGPGIGGGNDGGGGSESCASNVLCGPTGTCCAAGQECVEEACAAACATGIRCGDTCCPSGNVCLAQACVVPGAACQDSFDCAENEFCEPTLNQCLPQPDSASTCEYKPPVLPLAPALEWSWTGSSIHATYNQVINTPLVTDVDGDAIPDVVIVSSENYAANGIAYLRLLDGKTGAEKWAAGVAAYTDAGRVAPRGTPAVGDLDGNGTLEIVAPKQGGGVIAFNADGSILWTSKNANDTAYAGLFESVTVALADLDNDGTIESVLGGIILDSTGKLTSAAGGNRERWGANDASYGAVSIVADVDGDDATTTQFVVTGNRAIRRDGTFLWDVSASVTDGYPAIADLDLDGTPELVVIGQGKVRVQNALTGAVLATQDLQGTGRGGPPTIADFDNDGVLEIASANGTRYNVFEYDAAANPKLSVKWAVVTQDGSSNVTGSSVFDFEGDGSSEVVYNDECYARVYKGLDGSELFRIANSSATIHEMPVLVDVDGDNNTELVVVANDLNHTNGQVTCAGYAAAGDVVRHGIFVYGDSHDKWVRTRKVWNQHAYHITNVASDGTIPTVEPRSFTAAQNNDYRVSSQGKGVYNAPDLKVDLSISTQTCPTALQLRARVSNQGTLGVPAGVKVRFYLGTSNAGTLLSEKATTSPLLPGQSELVTFDVPSTPGAQYFVEVDGAAAAANGVDECNEDNNGAEVGSVTCPTVH